MSDKIVSTQLRCPKGVMDKIKVMAVNDGRSFNSMVVKILSDKSKEVKK